MKEAKTLRNFIIRATSSVAASQNPDGSMPAGRNGPYAHAETPLRNTCHWLVTFCSVYRWTRKASFLEHAHRALTYILQPAHRPHGANWVQRFARSRDRCNGLIGAAWVIEALVLAGRDLNSGKALQAAAEVFDLHPFDANCGLWRRIEIDGSILSFDRTFNHQLWFAASAARLAACDIPSAAVRVGRFLDKLDNLFSIDKNGLIRHRIRIYPWDPLIEPGSIIHHAYIRYDQFRSRSAKRLDPQKRDIGYQAFNLHAMAVLHRLIPDHPFWSGVKLKKALEFGRGTCHRIGIDDCNPYGYPYNPVGFEMALAIQEFCSESESERREWVRRQIEVLTKAGAVQYGDEADDPHTARARLYEAVDLEDVEL